VRRSWPTVILSIVLVAALGVHVRSSLDELHASRLLWMLRTQVESANTGGDTARLRSAVVVARELEDLAPDRVDVQAARGDLFLLLGRYHPAGVAYRRGLELQPRAELYFNLALVELAEGRLVVARQLASDAVRLDPALRSRLPVPLADEP